MRHLVNLLEFEVCYSFYILIVDVTGPIVLADPLYACGEIKVNVTNAIVLIMKNNTENCHPALQTFNVHSTQVIFIIRYKKKEQLE